MPMQLNETSDWTAEESCAAPAAPRNKNAALSRRPGLWRPGGVARERGEDAREPAAPSRRAAGADCRQFGIRNSPLVTKNFSITRGPRGSSDAAKAPTGSFPPSTCGKSLAKQ
jgi:hypothetical protein